MYLNDVPNDYILFKDVSGLVQVKMDSIYIQYYGLIGLVATELLFSIVTQSFRFIQVHNYRKYN